MDANSRGLFLQKFNLRSVRALRQIDANGIALSLSPIIFAKLLAYPSRLDPHHGIDDGVKSFRAAEDLQSDVCSPLNDRFVRPKFR